MFVGRKHDDELVVPLGQQTQQNRYVLVIVACLQNALLGGIIFGWASVDRTMMVASHESGGAAMSSKETTTIFSMASGICMIASVILGHVNDKCGPKVCSVVSSVIIGIGCVIFALSTEFYGFAWGLCLMGFGAPGIAVSIVHIANLFSENKFFVMSCINGSVTLSFSILAIFDVLWEKYPFLTFRILFGSYSLIVLLCITSSLFLWPNEPFEEEESDTDTGTETESLSPIMSRRSLKRLDDEEGVIDCHPCDTSKLVYRRSDRSESITSLKDQSFNEQVCSFRYLRMLVVFLVISFWANFYVASLSTEFADLQHFDTTQQHQLSQIFTVVMSLGIIGSLGTGYLMDRIGIEVCTFITILLGQVSIVILTFFGDNYDMMVFGFLIYALLRQFLYPVFIGALVSSFGFKCFGVLMGIGFFVSGIAQLFMGVLVQLVEGTCHLYDPSATPELLPNNCNPGWWKTLHIVQLISLCCLIPMPFIDHLEKLSSEKSNGTDLLGKEFGVSVHPKYDAL